MIAPRFTEYHPEPFRIPDAIEPLVVNRAWLLARGPSGDVINLTSWTGLTVWLPEKPLYALCLSWGIPGGGFNHNNHQSPDKNCTCGIYGADDWWRVPVGDVHGQVKLWGNTIPGEKGARAEFAYPACFYVHTPELLDEPVLKAFGVPIELRKGHKTQPNSCSDSDGFVVFLCSRVNSTHVHRLVNQPRNRL